MTIPLLYAERRWVCPNCTTTDVTRRADVHSQMHNCRGLAGLWAPMVPAGVRAKVEAHEREDYVGNDDVQMDGNGRPIMNVTVLRDDGQDTTVYAPCARADFREQ